MAVRDAVRQPQLRLAFVAILVTMIARVPYLVSGDTWFNLVLGREIAQHGLIQRNTITWIGQGAPVVDQQWLAHLLFYWSHEALGLSALIVMGALVITGTLGSAAATAVRRGALPGRTLLSVLVLLPAMIPQTVLRAQTLVLPLLVVLPLWLSDDVQQARRRTWWLIPLVALWGNLHGSALLAPLFSGVATIARPIEAWRRGDTWSRRLLARDIVRTAAFALALFISPYGIALVRYYGSTAANAAFPQFISEWQPASVHGSPEVLVTIGAVLLVVALSARSASLFEIIILGGMAVMAWRSIRHATPLAFAACALMPRLMDAAFGTVLRLETDALLKTLGKIGTPLAVVAWMIAVPLRASTLSRVYVHSPLPAAVTAALPAGRPALVDETDADRLVWYAPRLAGRVTHDARAETLPVAFLDSLSTLYREPTSAMSRVFLQQFPVVVVDSTSNPVLHAAMRRDPFATELAHDTDATAFRLSH